MIDGFPYLRYAPERVPTDEGLARGQRYHASLERRRSVRFFSDAPVPRAMIETAIRAANTAPSGAHQQPWTFIAISDPALKRKIRVAAEHEEKVSYKGGRMPDDWLDALRPLGTDWRKPYLETVPWIVVVFAQLHGIKPDGSRRKHYYVQESVGIATGLFIATLHEMGLSTLTHTPSPMGFLTTLLGRPKNEKPFILFPIGHPSEDAVVPDLNRKTLDEIALWFEPK
jgi:nitroreductase